MFVAKMELVRQEYVHAWRLFFSRCMLFINLESFLKHKCQNYEA